MKEKYFTLYFSYGYYNYWLLCIIVTETFWLIEE